MREGVELVVVASLTVRDLDSGTRPGSMIVLRDLAFIFISDYTAPCHLETCSTLGSPVWITFRNLKESLPIIIVELLNLLRTWIGEHLSGSLFEEGNFQFLPSSSSSQHSWIPVWINIQNEIFQTFSKAGERVISWSINWPIWTK